MKISDSWHRVTFILLSILDIITQDALANSKAGEVDHALELGTKLLAAGQLADALKQYDAAIEGDPERFLSYYRRATAHLALGQSKSALEDLDKALQLNPSFDTARIQRIAILIKRGALTEAKADAQQLGQQSQDAKSVKAREAQLATIHSLMEDMESARDAVTNGEHSNAIAHLDRVLASCSQSEEMRNLRVTSYLALGQPAAAIQDKRIAVKLTPDNRRGILELSRLLYSGVGDAEQALFEIRGCLKLDPDDRACMKLFKHVKRLVKDMAAIQTASNENRFDDCVSQAEELLRKEGETHVQYRFAGEAHLCRCHAKAGDIKTALQHCDAAVQLEPKNHDIVCDRAEAHMANEDYSAAIKDYQLILESDRHNQRAKKGMEKAQKKAKMAKKRNYYKILGVPNTADRKQIMKSYRKLAAKWHPDRFKNSDAQEKKRAERMFIDIADAKEVLSNAEKREKFDNGEDPLDPEQQHQGGGGPFGGFTFTNFNPFEGGAGGDGFTYEFHFG